MRPSLVRARPAARAHDNATADAGHSITVVGWGITAANATPPLEKYVPRQTWTGPRASRSFRVSAAPGCLFSSPAGEERGREGGARSCFVGVVFPFVAWLSLVYIFECTFLNVVFLSCFLFLFPFLSLAKVLAREEQLGHVVGGARILPHLVPRHALRHVPRRRHQLRRPPAHPAAAGCPPTIDWPGARRAERGPGAGALVQRRVCKRHG